MKEGWNVIIRHDPDFMGTNVWLVHKKGSELTTVHPIDLMLTTTINSWETPEPTLTFSGHDSIQFLQGLADGLAEVGFRPDILKASDKELSATRYHLEDMRKLVFKEK